MFKPDLLARLLRLEQQVLELLARIRRLPDRQALAGPPPPAGLIGVLDQDLVYSSSSGAQCTIWSGTPGNEVPATPPKKVKVTVYEWGLLPGEFLEAGTKVIVFQIGGYYYCVTAGCSADPNVTLTGVGAGGSGNQSGTNWISASASSTAALQPPPSTFTPYPYP